MSSAGGVGPAASTDDAGGAAPVLAVAAIPAACEAAQRMAPSNAGEGAGRQGAHVAEACWFMRACALEL